MEGLSISAMRLGSDAKAVGSFTSSTKCQFKLDSPLSADGKDDEDNNISDAASSSPESKTTAIRCYRPKSWSPEAEEAFRVQQAGWRDVKEYVSAYGDPQRWDNGSIQCTRLKRNGFYKYWQAARECEDKHLHCVKLFEYA